MLTYLAFLFCFSWGMLILGGVVSWRYALRHERPVVVAAAFSFGGAWLTLAGRVVVPSSVSAYLVDAASLPPGGQ